jgi:hypothetical protein
VIRLAGTIWLVLLGTGCAALDPAAVRDLSRQEQRALAALEQRLDDNRPALTAAVVTLGKLGAEWEERAFGLERELARAKRLESMQAPWTRPADEFTETQRSVVLYHLYELDMAEQRLLDARVAERHAAARSLAEAYDRHAELLGEAAGNLEIVLEYLDRPGSARIGEFAATFLAEVHAFRAQLQRSDNPRLRSRAEAVARQEQALLSLERQAQEALQVYLRLRGAGE